MIDKSIRADYVMQGKVRNYLGKQKMVKAPKKWKSAPNHPETELAYITKAEKDALIKLNLHGSMNGKANKGPSGIISLNGWGDAGDFGGSSSSSGGRDGPPGGGDRQMTYTAPSAKKAAPVDYSSLDNEEQQAVDRGEPTAQMTPKERNEQGHGPGGTNNPDYKQKQFEETGDIDALTDLTGFDAAPIVNIRDIQGEVDDPGSVSYDPLLKVLDSPDVDEGFKRYVRQVQQPIAPKPKSGILGTLGKVALTLGTAGAGAGLFGKDIANIANVAKWVGRGKDIKTALDTRKLNILGKEFNLPSNLRSTIQKAKGRQFDPKDPIGWTGEQKRKKTFHEPKGDGDKQQETTVQETIAGEKPLGVNLEDIRKKQMIMKTALDEGWYMDNQGRKIQLTDKQKMMLTNYITQIDQYLVDPRAMSAYGGRIDKALTGRSRDI